MKILFSFISMVFVSFSLHGQTSGTALEAAGSNNGLVGGATTSAFGTMHAEDVFRAKKGDRLSYKNIKGSPYLYKEAVKGKLMMPDGRVVEDVLLQFDLYTSDIIATLKDCEEVIIDRKYYSEIVATVDEKEVVYKRLNSEKPDVFYEVIYQDEDLSFFKQKVVTLREGSNSGLAKVDSKFKQKTAYYIKQGKKLDKVKLKKKNILSKFSKREQNNLKKYAKENGIKFKNEKDYAAIFAAVFGNTTEQE